MDADEVVVVESDELRSKRQKLTDFFERLPSSSQPQEFPCNMACYLRRFQLTDVLRRTASPKRSVGRPKKSTSSDSTSPPDENNKIEKGAVRAVYQSYSLRKKLEIVAYACEHTAVNSHNGLDKQS